MAIIKVVKKDFGYNFLEIMPINKETRTLFLVQQWQ